MGLLSKYIKAKKETPEQKMEENINMKQDILDMGVLVTGQKGTEVLVPSIKENEENKIEECVQGMLDIIDSFSTDKNDEEILVFDKEAFDSIYSDIPEEGVFTLGNDIYAEQDLLEFLDSKWNQYGSVQRRGDMEEDKNYLQPIPYTLIKQGDKYFTYTRLEGGGESRLHGKSSVGAGGHMGDVEHPWSFEHLLAVNNARELYEELEFKDEKGIVLDFDDIYSVVKKSGIKGLLYSDKSSVDSVHLGILNIIEVPSNYSINVNEDEKDILKGDMKTVEEIKSLNLENWSKMTLSVLNNG